MMTAGTLVIRADSSPEIGIGHVMRCLALAQAWQDAGGHVAWVATEMPDAVRRRLRQEDCELCVLDCHLGGAADLLGTVEIARQRHSEWVAVDGYQFLPGYYAALRTAGRRVLALDDMAHLERYPVDLLLNQNLSADRFRYAGKVSAEATLLLGPGYALLRREFRAYAGWKRPVPRIPRQVLISFGGSDADNDTARIMAALRSERPESLRAVVIVGAANPHGAELRALAATMPFPCEVRFNVTSVADLMAWADVAVTGAGSTVWELASMRLPALLGASEDNQLAGLTALQAMPLFRAGTVQELLSWDLRAEMERLWERPTATEELDALGSQRVVAVMRGMSPVEADEIMLATNTTP